MEALTDTANITDRSQIVHFAYKFELALRFSSAQTYCEAIVLLLIVLSFALVGVFSIRRIRSGMSQHNAAEPMTDAVRRLRLQIVGTTCVVFVTFLVRSMYATMYSLAISLQDASNSCPGVNSFCDFSCYNNFTHMVYWMFYTPEFQLMLVLVSKPVPLLIALWAMTSERMRKGMQRRETDNVEMNGGLLNKLAFWRDSRS